MKSNNVVLLPKTSNVDTLNQFMPIAMANFKFKIISKVLVVRMTQVIPFIFLINKEALSIKFKLKTTYISLLNRSTCDTINPYMETK